MKAPSLLDLKIMYPPAMFAEKLREKGDIFWWAPANFWVITSHQYARAILTSDDFTCDRTPFFISRMPNIDLPMIKDFFGVVGKMMVMSDAPAHTARRRICYDGFTNQTLQDLLPKIHRTVTKQIDHIIAKGSLEVVEDLAKIIPSTILADFFHIPEAERQSFYDWSNNMTQFFGGASQYRNEDGIEVNHSAKSLRDYFIDLIKQRRAQPSNDFLSMLLKHQSAFGLDDDEIISQAIMMLVAGQVTTTDQFCNNLYTLLSEPNAYEKLQEDGLDLKDALDELNRLDPAVTFIFRVTANDTLIGDQPIKKGDVIFISTHAVNRDPIVFEDSNTCLLSRKNNKQLSYGFGGHYCIGAKLAALEMKTCLQEMLKRLPNLRFISEDPPVRKHHSLAFSGFERLPLLFGVN
jgi:cytochrome P450